MPISLTPAQLNVLRRCHRGLHVFELGDAHAALMSHLHALDQLRLIRFDEARGYETTPSGEAWLVEFDE